VADIQEIGHEDADLVDAQGDVGESTATVEVMAVRLESMVVGDQGVDLGGAEGVVYERGFVKSLETESMTKAENVCECDVWSRDNN
jgi:hypothetical protein